MISHGRRLSAEDARIRGFPEDETFFLYELSIPEMHAYMTLRQYIRPSFGAAWPWILVEWKKRLTDLCYFAEFADPGWIDILDDLGGHDATAFWFGGFHEFFLWPIVVGFDVRERHVPESSFDDTDAAADAVLRSFVRPTLGVVWREMLEVWADTQEELYRIAERPVPTWVARFRAGHHPP